MMVKAGQSIEERVRDFAAWVARLEPKLMLDRDDLIEAMKAFELWVDEKKRRKS